MTPTQPQAQAKPKYTEGQSVFFSVTLTVSAVIDGQTEWDEEEDKYFYSVKDTRVIDSPADIYLNEAILVIDEKSSVFAEENLKTLHKLTVNKKTIPEDLPSCEFDPN